MKQTQSLQQRGASGRAAPASSGAIAPKTSKLLATKMVELRPRATDARSIERERLLANLLHAEGHSSVTRAADNLLAAGHSFPTTQEVQIQLLEHQDEARVSEALAHLDQLLASEAPQRRPILEQRLRRLAETADDEGIRKSAAALVRKL